METRIAAEGAVDRIRDPAARTAQDYFPEAYEQTRDQVFRYLRRFALDDDEAADLAARTFERAFTKLASYRGERDGFGAWLFRIARTQGIDAIRRRHQAFPLDFLRPEQHPHAGDGRPEDDLVANEESRELATLVQRLPRVGRECLALRYDAGLTARQIGQVIGKSEAATQKMISRALDRLREEYR